MWTGSHELREGLRDLCTGDGAAEGDCDCVDAAIAIAGDVRDEGGCEDLSSLG